MRFLTVLGLMFLVVGSVSFAQEPIQEFELIVSAVKDLDDLGVEVEIKPIPLDQKKVKIVPDGIWGSDYLFQEVKVVKGEALIIAGIVIRHSPDTKGINVPQGKERVVARLYIPGALAYQVKITDLVLVGKDEGFMDGEFQLKKTRSIVLPPLELTLPSVQEVVVKGPAEDLFAISFRIRSEGGKINDVHSHGNFLGDNLVFFKTREGPYEFTVAVSRKNPDRGVSLKSDEGRSILLVEVEPAVKNISFTEVFATDSLGKQVKINLEARIAIRGGVITSVNPGNKLPTIWGGMKKR